ncbi:MAG: HlyD family secretion protein [Terrimicrobiaceae bacterium]
MKFCRAVLFLLVALVGASCDKSDPSLVQGYIEGEFVHVASPFGGRLENLAVERGQEIEKGALLFALEETPELAARDEALRRVEQARAELEDAKVGQRPSEIQTLEAQLGEMRAALVLADIELERQQKLLATNVASKRDFDIARAQHDENTQRVAQLEATLVTAKLGSREDQIRAAEQNLLAQEAALKGADWNLSQKKQFSQQSALVSDTLYRPGDWVEAAKPVVVLLPPGNVKVRVFVSQELVGRVQVGSAAEVLVDGVEKPFAAKVTFISPRAEFTPPVIFSQSMREKFAFLVELSVDPETARKLHPGQPVDVRLKL